MSSFLKSAKAIYDIESDVEYVTIIYERFIKGKGYVTYVDHINTRPLANWTVLKSKSQSIPYEKFLDTMCEKTVEVRQKMAELALLTRLRFWTPPSSHLGLIVRVLGRGNLLKSFVQKHSQI